MEEEKLLKLYEILVNEKIIDEDEISSELFLSTVEYDADENDVEYNGSIYKVFYQEEIDDLFSEYKEDICIDKRSDLSYRGLSDLEEFIDWYEYKQWIDVELMDLFNYVTCWNDDEITILEMWKH